MFYNLYAMKGIKIFHFNALQAACIIIWSDDKECMVIDPCAISPQERQSLYEFIDKEGLEPKMILLTHAHFDHILGVSDMISRYGVPVYMNPKDQPVKDKAAEMGKFFFLETPDSDFDTVDIKDGDRITLGDMVFEVIETPGHTPGGVCFLCREEKLLISGDTLFQGTIGRTDLYLGNYDELIDSVQNKLMLLDGDIDVIPGHGPYTSISDERTKNPLLQPFNEPIEENEN